MVAAMANMEAKITSSGQVSLPAAMRRRWDADAVLVIDRGDYAIVRPIPDDIPFALRGSMAGPGASSDEVRAAERLAEGSQRDDR